MQDPVTLQIASAFLCLVIVLLLVYLYRISGWSRSFMPLNPAGFLGYTLAIFVLAAVLAALYGFDHSLLAISESAGLVLSVPYPAAALCVFLANFLIRPWELLPDNIAMEVMPRSLAALCLLSWIFYGVRRRELKIVWNSACWIYLAYVGWLMIATVLSGSVIAGISSITTTFLPTTAMAFLLLNIPQQTLDLQMVERTMIWSITGVIAIAIYTSLNDPTFFAVGKRLAGPGLNGNANDLGALIALAFPLAVVGMVIRGRGFTRLAGMLSLSILAAGLWLSQSRGALLALVLAGAAYFVFCRRNAGQTVILAALLLLVPVLAYKGMARSASDIDESRMSRWNYATTALRMVKDSPLWGVGVGNYPKLYAKYTEAWYEEGERTAHSSWVLVFAEAGVVGLLLLVLLFGRTFRAAWRMRFQEPQYLLALIAYGTAISFLSHTYWFLPYALMATCLSASRLAKEDSYEA